MPASTSPAATIRAYCTSEFHNAGIGQHRTSISRLRIFLFPFRPPTTVKPLGRRTAGSSRIDPLAGFDNNRVNPYIQNYNLEIQRELARNLTFEARYIGTKGTKLYGGMSINDVKFLKTESWKRSTSHAPAATRLVQYHAERINAQYGANADLGQGQINGTTLTGSAALRQNSIFRTLLANGNVGQFASALNASTTVTNKAGGLVRNGGFPDNFIVANPQYAAVVMNTNPGSSTYHSMNLQVTKRLSHGYTTSVGIYLEPDSGRSQWRWQHRVSGPQKPHAQPQSPRHSIAPMISAATAPSNCRSDRTASSLPTRRVS